jgi:hypothetical protein
LRERAYDAWQQGAIDSSIARTVVTALTDKATGSIRCHVFDADAFLGHRDLAIDEALFKAEEIVQCSQAQQ